MDDSSYRLNFDLHCRQEEQNPSSQLQRAMLKLIKLQSLVAIVNVVKCRKYCPHKICKFCINLYYARENAPLSAQMLWYIFPCVIQISTKFANFVGLYFPHFTTFRGQTLQFY
jgi:hypothetical protein